MADNTAFDRFVTADNGVRAAPEMFGNITEEPTGALRFVERDGKHRLQQQWLRHNYVMSETLWRDVPLEIETP